MKFSVLLPTRNRLELLKYAVETVRRQDYDNWEIIISDNYSEEDIAGYVNSLKEPRIKYHRTESFIPVTDNWNNALEKSTGDYVIMLGDDDCLMKGFFSTIKKLVETFKKPDFIYSNAYLYAYPGVLPDFPKGFLRPYSYASFFKSAREPFWLRREQALDLVHQSMNFKMVFTYNMQHSIINRNFINKLQSKGSFFQSPYPDFYATNVLLLKAERILICPYPLVTVGISPKSFGFYYFNKQENQGIEFLKNLADPQSIERLRHVILPGSKDRTSWLIAMETIKANYGSEFKLSVNYNRYRYLQILTVYGQSKAQLAELWKLLRWWEKLLVVPLVSLAAKLTKLFPRGFRSKIVGKLIAIINKTPQIDTPKSEHYYNNILEVFERAEHSPSK
jgi:glycosyltransferase involved in cell wall biosynthesis